ncbi:PadR family transcriptional regulator [Actinoallomurus acanthiterrae]
MKRESRSTPPHGGDPPKAARNPKPAGVQRVTKQQLDIAYVLLDAHVRGEELHGYEIMKRSGRNGPTTYRVLDRFEDAHLVDSRWEDRPEGDERPRRRFYRLNPAGAAFARELLEERRPEVLRELGRTEPGRSRAPRPGLGTLFSGLAGGAR